MDNNRKMNEEALNPWTTVKKTLRAKKMMTEQHVQRKKVVARPLTYTFMAQPLGKLESSFHYMKETNIKSVEAS